MRRLHFVLVVAIVASSLWLVNQQYKSRLLGGQLDHAYSTMSQLKKEYNDLSVERNKLLNSVNVDEIARKQLGMHQAGLAETHYVQYPAQSSVQSAAVAGRKP